MAKRARKARSHRRRRGLHGLGCGCGAGVDGLGMEIPNGHLTVQGPGAAPSIKNKLIVGGVVMVAAAGAGWFLYKKLFAK